MVNKITNTGIDPFKNIGSDEGARGIFGVDTVQSERYSRYVTTFTWTDKDLTPRALSCFIKALSSLDTPWIPADLWVTASLVKEEALTAMFDELPSRCRALQSLHIRGAEPRWTTERGLGESEWFYTVFRDSFRESIDEDALVIMCTCDLDSIESICLADLSVVSQLEPINPSPRTLTFSIHTLRPLLQLRNPRYLPLGLPPITLRCDNINTLASAETHLKTNRVHQNGDAMTALSAFFTKCPKPEHIGFDTWVGDGRCPNETNVLWAPCPDDVCNAPQLPGSVCHRRVRLLLYGGVFHINLPETSTRELEDEITQYVARAKAIAEIIVGRGFDSELWLLCGYSATW
ncbi:uncharacterized protein C8Q71DRAFT_726324 [Rhodofomes roseus]|uniref:Uncharacterized protein n=1 Tax=Rhodofomes roseus TaxID=34475 RepID=A0ABQ8K5A3_9APHY|nr:uncharacterized protein C8Q71DRAFT_726324 [Rhodofomes roseus]KAH9832152.1 hypothetical protein C8Q71DRAFT_726324 [Rhodofomes roseus]